MNLLTFLALRLGVRLATCREVPERYSPSEQNNNFTYFWINLDCDKNIRFLPTSPPLANGMVGAYSPTEEALWPDGRMADACLPYSLVGRASYRIQRVYGRTEFSFNNPVFFVVSEVLQRHVLVNWFNESQEARAQRKFKRDFQFSAKRMEILGKAINWRRGISKKSGVNALAKEFSHIDLGDHIFTSRFWGLDDHDYYLTELEFVLDSLVSSNDLEKVAGRYRLTGKALVSVSHFEEAQHKAAEARGHDTAIRRLTWVIAIAAAIQAIILFFK